MKSVFLAAILVAVVLLAVAGCTADGTVTTTPPAPTATATVCPNLEGVVVCQALLKGQDMLECKGDLEGNPRILHLVSPPEEYIWDILGEDFSYLEVSLDRCGRPTSVERIHVNENNEEIGRETEWPFPLR